MCPHKPWNLYEINTRVLLRELGVHSLREVPDAYLDRIAEWGFDLVWLMGVWAPSEDAARLAREHAALAESYRHALPDFVLEDVVASPYAVAGYTLSPLLGDAGAIGHLRQRLRERGIGLVLDFIPNHTACDHPWVTAHPERYVGSTAGPGSLAHPVPPGQEDVFAMGSGGPLLFHGRDPYFPPWTDTAQLDYRRRGTWHAMIAELLAVARFCDGVRCDMAMLVLSAVFARTWGRPDVAAPPPEDRATGEFWAEAIDAVRRENPGFLFMAEAYWGTEPQLQQLGFDFTYDKTLYDHLLLGNAEAVVAHLQEGQSGQRRSARFLENHDEERIAEQLPHGQHQVAALVGLTLPGLRLFHHGQMEGARRRLPVQLSRRAQEERDPELALFYDRLLRCLKDPVLLLGSFCLHVPRQAWEGNPSHRAMVVYAWDGSVLHGHGTAIRCLPGHRLLVANLANHRAQCRVPLQLPGIAGRKVRLSEIFAVGPTPAGDAAGADGAPIYVRDGDQVFHQGLYVDLPGHTAQVLSVNPLSDSAA